jgi:hypothetical protein
MNATTSIGHGRTARQLSVRTTVAGALASATLLAILNPSVMALSYRLQTAIGGGAQAQALAMTQTMDDSSVQGRAGTGSAVANGNAYGGQTLPFGESNTQTLTFTNTGTAPVTALTATAATCSQVSAGSAAGTATDFCDNVLVTITSGGVAVFDGTARAFGHAGPVDVLTPSGTRSVPPGQSVSLDITITMSPKMDNTYQGLQIDQPIQWRFGA